MSVPLSEHARPSLHTVSRADTKAVSFKHFPQLDGLRAIAVLIVFAAHCNLERVIPGGLGVTIFLFLSGYLITSLLRSEAVQTGGIDFKGFYVRRTLRIWPPLYLTMVFVALGITLVAPSIHIDPWGAVAQALFVSNYSGLWGHPTGVPDMPLWSLAIEEHFYLLFPALFGAFLMRLPAARAAAWCAAACATVLAIRIFSVPFAGDIQSLYYWSHTRIDSILFGCCLALWNNPALDSNAWTPKRAHVAVALAVMVLCLLIRNEIFRQTLRYSLQGAALFVIFAFVLSDRGPSKTLLSWRPAAVDRNILLYLVSRAHVHDHARARILTVSDSGPVDRRGRLADVWLLCCDVWIR